MSQLNEIYTTMHYSGKILEVVCSADDYNTVFETVNTQANFMLSKFDKDGCEVVMIFRRVTND